MPARYLAKLQIKLRRLFNYFEVFFVLAQEILSNRNFIYLASVAVGISCALAVILLKTFAHKVFLFANYANGYLKLPYANSIFPIIGILLTVFVIRNFLDGSIEKGSSRILHAVAKKNGIMPRKQMYAQIITSSLTVGMGGSAGLESPITITGAAFGSNFAQKYKLSQKDRILLLACGVAAGIGAAFNAPIAGVLFAIEIVLVDVSISAFIPIIISAATGALISTIVLSDNVLLHFTNVKKFDFHNTIYYIILGVLAGLVATYHAKNFRRVEHFFSKFKNNSYRKALMGALVLAVLIFLFPTLFGEGYESIKALSTNNPSVILENTLLEKYKDNDWVLLSFIGAIVMLKSFATGLTLGSGGNGGNFAPSLFVGSYLGFFVAKSIGLLGINSHLPIANFAMVGMAGILSGLFHAPLTAIFLIGEITGGYELMVPLMIVSSISFAVTRQFEKYSMDVKPLADSGEVFTSDKDKNILQSISLKKLIDTHNSMVYADENLEKIVQLYSTNKQTLFPVVDQQNQLISYFYFNDINPYLLNQFRLKHTLIKDIAVNTQPIVSINDDLDGIMEIFDSCNYTELPIVHQASYVGSISKLKILEAYRTTCIDMQIE